MKHIKLFEQFINEVSSQDEKKFKTFIDIYNDKFDGEDFNSLKSQLKAKGITAVLFSELKNYKDFPPNSIIFTGDSDPNDTYISQGDLSTMTRGKLANMGIEFSGFKKYKSMYGDVGEGDEISDGVAFIF